MFDFLKSAYYSISSETAKEPSSSRSRDFSPVNNVPFHGTLGLKSKLQKLEREVLSQSQVIWS